MISNPVLLSSAQKQTIESQQQIYAAIAYDEVDILRQLLNNYDLDLDALKNESGLSPLWCAITEQRKPETVALLLKHTKNVDAKYKEVTPLWYAAHTNQVLVAGLLIKKGASLNATHPNGETLLFTAAFSGYDKMVSLLVRHGVDPNQISMGFTPLFVASHKGHANVVNVLLAVNCDINLVSPAADYQTAIFTAAFNNNIAVMELLLSNSADVEIPDSQGHTVLMVAAMQGTAVCMELILIAKPEIDKSISFGQFFGRTALSYAYQNNNIPAVEALKSRGAKPCIDAERISSQIEIFIKKQQDATLKIFSAYELCCSNGYCVGAVIVWGLLKFQKKTCFLFDDLEKIADANLSGDVNELDNSVKLAFIRIIATIVKMHGDKIFIYDHVSNQELFELGWEELKSPFYLSDNFSFGFIFDVSDMPMLLEFIIADNKLVVLSNIMHAVGVMEREGSGYLLYDANFSTGELFLSNVNELIFAIKSILQNQADDDILGLRVSILDQDLNVDPASAYYTMLNQIRSFVLKKRVERGELFVTTADGYTIADYAVAANDFETFQELSQLGFFNENKKVGELPLFLASQTDHRLNFTKMLIAYQVNLNSLAYLKQTSLFVASATNAIKTAQILLEQGADPNIRCKEAAITALHVAARYGHIDMAKILLKHGAQIHDTDLFSRTAFLMAVEYKQLPVARLLLQLNANVNQHGFRGDTALHLAVANKDSEMMRLLLNFGINKHGKNFLEDTPLCKAVREGYFLGVKRLLEAKAHAHQYCGYTGLTPLSLANKKGEEAIVTLLLSSGADNTDIMMPLTQSYYVKQDASLPNSIMLPISCAGTVENLCILNNEVQFSITHNCNSLYVSTHLDHDMINIQLDDLSSGERVNYKIPVHQMNPCEPESSNYSYLDGVGASFFVGAFGATLRHILPPKIACLVVSALMWYVYGNIWFTMLQMGLSLLPENQFTSMIDLGMRAHSICQEPTTLLRIGAHIIGDKVTTKGLSWLQSKLCVSETATPVQYGRFFAENTTSASSKPNTLNQTFYLWISFIMLMLFGGLITQMTAPESFSSPQFK